MGLRVCEGVKGYPIIVVLRKSLRPVLNALQVLEKSVSFRLTARALEELALGMYMSLPLKEGGGECLPQADDGLEEEGMTASGCSHAGRCRKAPTKKWKNTTAKRMWPKNEL